MAVSLPPMIAISVRGATERHQHIRAQFAAYNLPVPIFYGVDARQWGLRTVLPYLDDTPNWQPDQGTPHYIGPESIGCILSHWMVWQILQRSSHEEFLIFEDDIVLCKDFPNQLLQLMQQLPDDWQYVFVGRGRKVNGELVAPNVLRPEYPPFCTHAYLVKKSTLPILIQTNEMAWAPIDIQIQKRSLNYLTHYVAEPPLVWQKDREETHPDYISNS